MKKDLLAPIKTVEELNQQMTHPSVAVEQINADINEEILILGVGGKMGPTLAEMIFVPGVKSLASMCFLIQRYDLTLKN